LSDRTRRELVAVEELQVDGQLFRLVCVRRTGVAVYRGDGSYLRWGDALASELQAHLEMLDRGHPVADIIEVGHFEGSLYYVERSLGEQTFGDACEDPIDRGGSMGPEEFTGFLDVMRRHAHAQLVGHQRTRPPGEFAEFIGVAQAMVNTPALAKAIHEAWGDAAAILSGFPAALQHCDLHVFNACPGGIIDLEGAGWAPVGYDVATAVLEPTLAEPRWLDGQLGLQWFTPDQVRTYLEVVDEEFHRFELPGPSTQIHAHLICRAINLNSHVHSDAAIWEARQSMLAQVLQGFLDHGHVPLSFR